MLMLQSRNYAVIRMDLESVMCIQEDQDYTLLSMTSPYGP